MPALTAKNLRKTFGPQVVLDGVSFTLGRGEKVGLIGANGAGKSTLAKILASEEPADGGEVAVRRGLTIRYLAQEPVLDPASSAREIVEEALTAWRAATNRHGEVSALLATSTDPALGDELAKLDDTIEHLGGWEQGHRALAYLDRLGVQDIERPVGQRSGGERRRIALARLLVARPDVAILDEPTNHLDADTAEWLEEHLSREFPGAVVLVTHDRYFLDAIATRIVELERGTVASYEGGFADYLEKKSLLMQQEDRVESNRQNALRREREWLSRGPKARTTKQKARINRAHALEAETPANSGRPDQVQLSTTSARLGKTILECRQVTFGVGAGESARRLVEPFDLFVTAGERIGVLGPNGVGKTTFLRTILGQLPPVSGELVVGRNTSIAYLDQARAQLDDDKSIFDDVRGDLGTTVSIGKDTLDLRTYLEMFLFDAGKQRQKVGALSGGERARVALAKMLRQGANLLLFDEPTNDLDLPTLGALEDLLIGYDACAIVVTHDRAFLDRVATATLAFRAGEGGGPATVEKHAGGWTEYKAHEEARRRAKEAAATEAKKKASQAPPAAAAAGSAKKTALTWAERKELDGLLDRVDEVERVVRKLEAELAHPDAYTKRAAEAPAILAKLEAARAESAALMARWELLEVKKSS